jgi:hypothetical protein
MAPLIRAARRPGAATLALLVALFAVVPAARADAGWFESGDAQLRMDLQLLNDAEVIRLPVTTWPMPRAAVEYALASGKIHFVVNRAVAAALDRVQARISAPRGPRMGAWVAAGEPGLLRDFDSFARERGELGAHADFDSGRFSASLKVAGAADPADDRSARADGSQVTLQLGNWLVSAHMLERFWGPSHESSLILSNNARPMPTVMVERAEARAFTTPLLSWLGPWRMSFGISQMESERADIDSPLFMAWRVVVMPFRKIELGFSRTAQFCGKQLECNLDVFGNLLAGNDNVGIDATPENEPGNQMAGFDIRWNSPLGNLPYAVYSQYIGEDESSYLPAKYLAQLGVEGWKPFGDGGLLQVFAEYSSTTCSANTSAGPYYNCAYNQGRFDVEGYRYRGRVIGYTADGDAETYSAGAIYLTSTGATWSATARNAILNRDDADSRNLVSPVRSEYDALELGWRGKLLGESISVDLGVESLRPIGEKRDVQPYGFVRWSHEFEP